MSIIRKETTMDELSSITAVLKEEIRSRTSSAQSTFELWFGDINLIGLTEDKAIISTPTQLRKNIISSRFSDLLKESVSAVLGFTVDIELVSMEENNRFKSGVSNDSGIYFPYEDIEESERKEKRIAEILNDPNTGKKSILDDYTFENFIEGESNKLAKAACYAVAKEPCTYNPLFIHGQSGLGKTHLLYAIMNYMKKHTPEIKIVYKKSETFINELIEAIANHQTSAFKEKYRTADVLLIDDIQFIAGKESTQEEFFHTFSALYENEKQIILTSDRPPREIKPLTDRLRTRFESGLVIDVLPPSFELRTAIINKKINDMGLTVDPELVKYMAERLNNNIRQIEGILKKLYAINSFTGVEISKDVVEQAISVVDPGNIPVDAMVDRILSAVCKKHGVSDDDIRSKKKTDAISKARHVAIYITRRITGLSYKEIGKIFNRDHATVIASCNKVEINIKTVNNYEGEIEALIKEIKG